LEAAALPFLIKRGVTNPTILPNSSNKELSITHNGKGEAWKRGVSVGRLYETREIGDDKQKDNKITRTRTRAKK
jgi:hypothetical protein